MFWSILAAAAWVLSLVFLWSIWPEDPTFPRTEVPQPPPPPPPAPVAPQLWQNEAEVGLILHELFPGCVWQHNVKLDWNINKHTGELLEFDWYCANLRLAVEYQGEQHYQVVQRFDGTDAEAANRRLYGRRMRDARKEVNCEDQNVYLLRVPYTVYNKRAFILRDRRIMLLRDHLYV